MATLIKTKKGTTGVITDTKDGKLLCKEVDPVNHNETGKTFAVSPENAEHIGFICYPEDLSPWNYDL